MLDLRLLNAEINASVNSHNYGKVKHEGNGKNSTMSKQ